MHEKHIFTFINKRETRKQLFFHDKSIVERWKKQDTYQNQREKNFNRTKSSKSVLFSRVFAIGTLNLLSGEITVGVQQSSKSLRQFDTHTANNREEEQEATVNFAPFFFEWLLWRSGAASLCAPASLIWIGPWIVSDACMIGVICPNGIKWIATRACV